MNLAQPRLGSQAFLKASLRKEHAACLQEALTECSASKVAINQHQQGTRSQILAKPHAALGNVHVSLITLRKLHVEGLGSLPAEAEGPGGRLKAAFFPLQGEDYTLFIPAFLFSVRTQTSTGPMC